MSRYLTYRKLNWLLVLAAIVGMAFALVFLQHYKGLTPCPLCVFQRVGLMVMGAFALIAGIFNPRKLWLRAVLWVGSMAGILWAAGVAARHVWLQNLPPDKVPSCGPGLDYWLEALPLQEVVNQVLSGSGECAVVDWTFMGMSIPVQSLIFFSLLVLINLVVGMRIWQDK